MQNEPYEDILFGVFADHADMFRTRDDRLLRDMSRSQQPGSRFARRVGIRIRTRIVADNACDSARNVNYRNFPARILNSPQKARGKYPRTVKSFDIRLKIKKGATGSLFYSRLKSSLKIIKQL